MQKNRQGSLYKDLQTLQIPTNKSTVVQFYYNFSHILQSLKKLLQSCCYKLSISLAQLTTKKQLFSIKRFIGLVTIRLLYIDVPQYNIQDTIQRKDKKNNIFCLLQTFSLELLKETYKIGYGEDDWNKMILNSLEIIQKEIEISKISIPDNNFQVLLQLRHFKNIYKKQIKLNKRLNIGNKTFCKQRIKLLDKQNAHIQLFHMYENIINNLHQKFNLDVIKTIIEEVVLVFGVIIYLQTLFKGQKLSKTNILKQQDKRISSQFKTHAYIQIFEISIVFISKQNCFDQVHVQISFFEQNISFIQVEQFYKIQIQIGNFLAQKYLGKKMSLHISKNIYCMDKISNIGSGTFGSIFRATGLVILANRKVDNSKQFKFVFERKKFAIKQLIQNSQEYQRKGYKVQRARQKHILSMLREIKYYEDMKKSRRLLGFEVQRDLVGIQYLITLEQYIRIADPLKIDAYVSFLVFQQCKTTLSNQQILGRIKNRQQRELIIYQIYSQIFESLYCLHEDINNLYHQTLKKYFQLQGKRQQSQGDANLKEKDRCGIYHRDIKAHNIAIDYDQLNENNISNIHIQIIDFGLAGIANFQKYKTQTNCGSQHYMAPEMKNRQKYDQKIDIWSVGVTLYEHLSDGRRLYKSQSKDRIEITKQLMESELQDLQKMLKVKQWSQIVRGCLTIVPENRKSASQLLRMVNKYKLYFIDNKKNIIENFTNRSDIACIRTNILKHQYDELKIKIIQSQPLKYQKLQNQKITHIVQLQQFLNNFKIRLKHKIPVLFAVLTIFFRKQIQYNRLLDLIKFFQNIQVLIINVDGYHQSLHIRIQQNAYQNQKQYQNIRSNLKFFKYELSQQFQLNIEIQKFKITSGCVLLKDHNKYKLDSVNQCQFITGYDISQIMRQKQSTSFNRTMYIYDNEIYNPSHNTNEILCSKPISQLNNNEIDIFWAYCNRSSQQDVLEKLFSLNCFFRQRIEKEQNIRFIQESCQQNENRDMSDYKNIFLLFQIFYEQSEYSQKTKKQRNCIIKIHSVQFIQLLKILLKQNKLDLSSSKFKQVIQDLFKILKNDKISIGYNIIMSISLIPFVQPQYKLFNNIKIFEHNYFERGQYLLCRIHQFISNLISFYNNSEQNKIQKKFLTNIKDQMKPIASILQNKIKNKLCIRQMEYFPKNLNQNSKNPQITNLFLIVKKALHFPSQNKHLITMISQFKCLFLALDLLKWLISNTQNSFIIEGQPLYQLPFQQEK